MDFACVSARLVIELDGGQHNLEPDRASDESRDERLRRRGYTVLRFWNNDVMANSEGVLEVVRRALTRAQRLPHPGSLRSPTLPDLGEGKRRELGGTC